MIAAPVTPATDDVQLEDPVTLYCTVKLVAALAPVCAAHVSCIALLDVGVTAKPPT